MGKTIGLDIGYGFTKSCYGGDLKIFPTAVPALVPKYALIDPRCVTANGEKFLVGDDAEREGSGLLETRTSDFVTSNAWLAMLGHALGENGFNTENALMVLCIPPGLFSKDYAREIEEAIKSSTIIVNHTSSLDFRHASIMVIPQGAGIFFSFLSVDPTLYYKNVVVLDIGHFTCDFVYFPNGRYVESATKTITIGTSHILDSVSKEFYRKYGFSIPSSEALRLLKEGAISILGEPYHLPEAHELIEPYLKQIRSVVDSSIEKLPSLPDAAIAGGGGALMLQDFLSFIRKCLVARRPETANAHGCWYYGHKLTGL